MIQALAEKVKILLAPASQTAAATRSSNVDCIGADYVKFTVNLAAQVNTSAVAPTIALLESDDTTASNFATWSSSFSRSETLTAAHGLHYCVDTRTRKRYIQLSVTTATHTTNDIITAGAEVTFFRREQPGAGTASMVGSTNDNVVVG